MDVFERYYSKEAYVKQNNKEARNLRKKILKSEYPVLEFFNFYLNTHFTEITGAKTRISRCELNLTKEELFDLEITYRDFLSMCIEVTNVGFFIPNSSRNFLFYTRWHSKKECGIHSDTTMYGVKDARATLQQMISERLTDDCKMNLCFWAVVSSNLVDLLINLIFAYRHNYGGGGMIKGRGMVSHLLKLLNNMGFQDVIDFIYVFRKYLMYEGLAFVLFRLMVSIRKYEDTDYCEQHSKTFEKMKDMIQEYQQYAITRQAMKDNVVDAFTDPLVLRQDRWIRDDD
jgi:hypothetical protein